MHLAAELAGRLAEIQRQAAALESSRARLVQAQDAERRRLERDLHDGVQQQVVALLTRLELARNQLGRDPAAAGRMLGEARAEVRRVLEDLRELARGIHPPVLSDQGLVAAVEARVSRLPIGVVIEAPAEVRRSRYAQDVEAAAYFFVSEALANVLKHSGAAEARVSLRGGRETLVVEVADDGVGFVPAEVTGSGLAGLADRVEAVGGRLHVDTRPGGGTRLRAELPAGRRAGV